MRGREFSGFDVDTLTEAVSPPPLDELRSTARFRRRRSVAMGTAALVALAGLTVVPLVTGADRPDPVVPAEPSRTEGDMFTLTGPDSGVDVDVSEDSCVMRFAYTGDRGRTWSAWDAARFQGTRCTANAASGTPSGRNEVAVLGDRSYLVSDAGTLHLSTDFGRTWRDANSAIVAVPAFPATARPVFCGFGCRPLAEPLAVDPASGTVYRLTAKMPSWRPLQSLYPAADGSIWAAYQMGSGATLARSADGGATWTAWEVGDDVNVAAVVGLDDREGYALINPPATASGGLRLLRTTDGAKTWTDVGVSLPWTWDLTVGSDGSLLAISTGDSTEPDRLARLLVSRDDGRHFTVAREYGPSVMAASVAPGFAWLYGRDGPTAEPDHVLVTTDATSWSRFALKP
ncbi:sialidase family protein [Micromonospora sp. WMMD967]|uniref:WD40/YVTN/BNR-like repeat-containing protein n=1 Tax=Micromonospora sp. WMMD967 TaxID=3016101 RepID=UPI0024179C12|nr:sialidase family protein [Micromonospora sp. WMMD967]MDG4839047.1 sialidase family protein [Micromonospora sp. WMMD967]